MTDIETTVQLEEAKGTRGDIPAELSFEEISKNNTLPPCSLNDFMDYLCHVEQNAEHLQFFLWYCDYVRRWSELLPRQKALSPAWDSEKTDEAPIASRFVRYSHRRAASEKMIKIISIMEMEQSSPAPHETTAGHRRHNSVSTNYSRPGTTHDTKEDLQPFTIQPFRDELTRVVRHYIAESSPRQLRLTQRDRGTCLLAVSHTTHPSALLPAFIVAEANLKGCSHPAFIRWSISNAEKPRLVALCSISGFLFVLGLAIDTILVLSGLTRYIRLFCLLLWWPGISILVAAARYRICLILHLMNQRQLRPWELVLGEGEYASGIEPTASGKTFRKHTRGGTAASTVTTSSSLGADPLRKPSLQTFGPRNEPDAEPWMELYASRSLYSRIFGETLSVHNQGLRMMQDRAVFVSIAWGGLAATVLAVASLAVPSGNMYLRGSG